MKTHSKITTVRCHSKLIGAVVALIIYMGGCAQFQPQPSYEKTAELIRQQTGVERMYQPDTDQASVLTAVHNILNDGLTVDEAVQVAMLNNPGFQAIFHDVGLSVAEVLNAGLPSNPNLSASVRFPEGGGRASVTTALSQNVTELLLIPIRKQIAQSRLQQIQLHVANQAVALISSVKRAAYQLIAAQDAEQITQQNVELAERSVKLAQRRFTAGQTDKLDVNVAQIELLNVKRQLLTISRKRLVAHAELEELLGLSRVSEDWTMTDKLSGPIDLPSMLTLINQAMGQRLDLRISELRIEEAGREIDREKAGIISNLSLGIERERSDSPPNLTGPTLDLTLPLWHQNQPQIARAQLALVIHKRQREATINAAVAEVRKAAATLHANAELVQFFNDQSLPLARQHVEATARAYENGQHDILRLTQAQQSLIAQRLEYAQAMSDYATSLADLEKALGGIIPPARSPELAPNQSQVPSK